MLKEETKNQLVELRKIYKNLEVAKELNLKDCPYSELRESFVLRLKEILKFQFGEDITFDREETFAYFQCYYKKIGMEINHYDGIILSIESNDVAMQVLEDFIPVFNELMGINPLCKYDFRDKRVGTSYPTIEWSFKPAERIYDLVHYYNGGPGTCNANFEDYYTTKIINLLICEGKLLTAYGYKKLFEPYGRYDFDFTYYIKNLIIKVCPEIDQNNLSDWFYSDGQKSFSFQ